MRALVVSPGPQFSTWDVFRGWCRGLQACGVEVDTFDLEMPLNLFGNMRRPGETERMFSDDDIGHLATQLLKGNLYDWWPEVIVIVQAAFVSTRTMDIMRDRGHKVVVIHTESPYEDDRQIEVAAHADLNLINDPTNLDKFPAGTQYMPHAYDPGVHKLGPPVPGEESEVCFVGTGYPSRMAWLERVDWSGIDLALAGHWKNAKGTSLEKYVGHDIDQCLDNDDTAVAYRSTQMSFNIYRTEAEHAGNSFGWAVGPREIELAACGTFFARQPRGEGDDLFPMLPTFETPEELEAVIREWLPRHADRTAAAMDARAAIADRTFPKHAAHLLRLLDA